jgi:hypothetical protein
VSYVVLVKGDWCVLDRQWIERSQVVSICTLLRWFLEEVTEHEPRMADRVVETR